MRALRHRGGNRRGYPRFVERVGSTSPLTAMRPTVASRWRARSGPAGASIIPPEDLGPKGDLSDWLRVGAKGDPAAFRSVLEQGLATSATPWALQIQRLPSDLAPWDLEDHAGVRDLLCEISHQGLISRDAHLRLLAERCGVALATLQEAAPRTRSDH